jgi:hypothetical protein
MCELVVSDLFEFHAVKTAGNARLVLLLGLGLGLGLIGFRRHG